MEIQHESKLNYKYVIAITLFALAVFMNGCHGVNW
jgi:hypothetical protein